MKQWYVFEMNGFAEEEAQEFFNQAFAEVEWGEEHSMGISHLTDKGVADLKKHVFKQEVTE
ncbi:hypothetical protein [Jeotgalibaca porci]|uniref:hypothetical protein n=1 Tax=Jeotgalibaca porci TaxID=1868793 RepID=UPI0035A120A2